MSYVFMPLFLFLDSTPKNGGEDFIHSFFFLTQSLTRTWIKWCRVRILAVKQSKNHHICLVLNNLTIWYSTRAMFLDIQGHLLRFGIKRPQIPPIAPGPSWPGDFWKSSVWWQVLISDETLFAALREGIGVVPKKKKLGAPGQRWDLQGCLQKRGQCSHKMINYIN